MPRAGMRSCYRKKCRMLRIEYTQEPQPAVQPTIRGQTHTTLPVHPLLSTSRPSCCIRQKGSTPDQARETPHALNMQRNLQTMCQLDCSIIYNIPRSCRQKRPHAKTNEPKAPCCSKQAAQSGKTAPAHPSHKAPSLRRTAAQCVQKGVHTYLVMCCVYKGP